MENSAKNLRPESDPGLNFAYKRSAQSRAFTHFLDFIAFNTNVKMKNNTTPTILPKVSSTNSVISKSQNNSKTGIYIAKAISNSLNIFLKFCSFFKISTKGKTIGTQSSTSAIPIAKMPNPFICFLSFH